VDLVLSKVLRRRTQFGFILDFHKDFAGQKEENYQKTSKNPGISKVIRPRSLGES
jgi:hypothetical protein